MVASGPIHTTLADFKACRIGDNCIFHGYFGAISKRGGHFGCQTIFFRKLLLCFRSSVMILQAFHIAGQNWIITDAFNKAE